MPAAPCGYRFRMLPDHIADRPDCEPHYLAVVRALLSFVVGDGYQCHPTNQQIQDTAKVCKNHVIAAKKWLLAHGDIEEVKDMNYGSRRRFVLLWRKPPSLDEMRAESPPKRRSTSARHEDGCVLPEEGCARHEDGCARQGDLLFKEEENLPEKPPENVPSRDVETAEGDGTGRDDSSSTMGEEDREPIPEPAASPPKNEPACEVIATSAATWTPTEAEIAAEVSRLNGLLEGFFGRRESSRRGIESTIAAIEAGDYTSFAPEPDLPVTRATLALSAPPKPPTVDESFGRDKVRELLREIDQAPSEAARHTLASQLAGHLCRRWLDIDGITGSPPRESISTYRDGALLLPTAEFYELMEMADRKEMPARYFSGAVASRLSRYRKQSRAAIRVIASA